MLAHIDRPGSGIPIVLVHGSGFSKEIFAGQFESDSLRDRHLIAVDLPGHGDTPNSADPRATYTYSGFAHAILDFICETDIDRCLVAGWSLGGHAAIDLIDKSDKVAGVMAFGAPPAPNGPLGIVRSMHFCRLLLLAGKGKLSDAEARYFEQACLNGHGKGRFLDTLARTDPMMRPCVSKGIMERKGASQKKIVENASTPVCLLQGSNDMLVRTNYMRGLAGSSLFGGHTIVFEGCGHAPFMEKPREFNDLLAQFAVSVEVQPATRGRLQSAVNF